MMQTAIRALCAIAPTFTDALEVEQLEAIERQLGALERPLSRADVEALVTLLPREGETAYGLNWTIVHAIEAAPCWPLWEVLQDRDNLWVSHLRTRLANGGLVDPSDA